MAEIVVRGPCLTPHIGASNRDIPDILLRSIVRRHIYKVTKYRWSRSESAPTTEGQTCRIARYTTLVVRGLGAIMLEL